MPTATRITRSIYGVVAIAMLLSVAACSQQSTEPDEEVWPPTEIPAEAQEYCEPDRVQSDRIIIDFYPHVTSAQIDSFAAIHGLDFVGQVSDGNSYQYTLSETTETSHELAIRIRSIYPEMVLWAEPTSLNALRYDSGLVIHFTSTVDLLWVWLRAGTSDSLFEDLSNRFALKSFPQDRWPPFVQAWVSEWESREPENGIRIFLIDRDTYEVNQFDASCVGVLIYDLLKEEYAPDPNPLLNAAPIDRILSFEYTH